MSIRPKSGCERKAVPEALVDSATRRGNERSPTKTDGWPDDDTTSLNAAAERRSRRPAMFTNGCKLQVDHDNAALTRTHNLNLKFSGIRSLQILPAVEWTVVDVIAANGGQRLRIV
jgi:hypothetical protein